MNDILYNQIVEWIPSESLKKVIRAGESCSDLTMLSAACSCAPDFDARLDMLEKLAAEFDGELGAYAARLRETEIRKRELFTAPAEQTVYQLDLWEVPEDENESYLCVSYEAALGQIENYYAYYDAQESEEAVYIIEKRRLFSGKRTEKMNDIIGRAVLKQGGVLKSIDIWEWNEETDCCGNCLECRSICDQTHPKLCSGQVEYPCFTRNGDAVRYREWRYAGSIGMMCYGVVLCREGERVQELFVVPLNCEDIRLHDFEDAHLAHDHVDAPFAEVISADELPEDLRENYRAYRDFLLKG